MMLKELSHKKILLLQGPVGYFFKNLAEDLLAAGAEVYKINFNGGDEFFYKSGHSYTGTVEELTPFIQNLVAHHHIDTIMLFGDCRPIHRAAKNALSNFKLDWYVFEEGYLRPNHITCEKGGVNGYSTLPVKAQQYLKNNSKQEINVRPVIEVGRTFWFAALWAMIYYFSAWVNQKKYQHYQHHRPLTIREAWPWIRGAFRKYVFKLKEQRIEKILLNEKRKQYFLVPLQTHNDAQIHFHSPYQTIEDFIEEVMHSFAANAPQNTLLVLKQHPFDRGYKDYSQIISKWAKELSISQRVYYIHDQYLPDLLEAARGVVVVNSTVGMSAVESLIPVKVCGTAVYNLNNLTMQCSLDAFWVQSLAWKVNEDIVNTYMQYLQHTTQFNGSFYKRINSCSYKSGVIWSKTISIDLPRSHPADSLLNVK